MKKILHILGSNTYSGAENVASTIISNLDDQFEMVYASPEGPIREILAEKDIEFIGMNQMTLKEVKKVIDMWEPDLIHSHDFTATLYSLLSVSRIPVISQIHQNPTWLQKTNIRSIAFYLSCLKLKQLTLVNEEIYTKNPFLRLFSKKIDIIPNIIDIEEVKRKSEIEEIRESYDLIFLGRLVDVKDPIRFINIVDEVSKISPDIRAIMIGDGELKEKCINEVKKRGLNNNIFIKGFINNPYPYLKKSKILVMTSKSEGTPMSVLEALSLGKPILISDVDGIDNLIDDEYGKVCGDNEMFVSEIMKLLTNQSLYETKSENARSYAQSMFNLNNYVNKFKKKYDKQL